MNTGLKAMNGNRVGEKKELFFDSNRDGFAEIAEIHGIYGEGKKKLSATRRKKLVFLRPYSGKKNPKECLSKRSFSALFQKN